MIATIPAIATFATTGAAAISGIVGIRAPSRIYLNPAAIFGDAFSVIDGFCASLAFQAVVLF
jgi:hypothetical protein